MTGRFQRLLWLACLAAAVFCLALVIDSSLSQTRGGDGPSYLILAKSIALGHGYSDINLPGSPPHTQYPPLFPLMLALIYFAFGYNFLLMKLLLAAFAIAALVCVREFFSAERDRLYGTLIALLTGTNFYFLYYTNEIRAEIPFTFISFLILLYAKKRPLAKANALHLTLVFPLLLALAYMTRMIGVVLFGAAFLYLLLEVRRTEGLSKGFKRAALFAVAASIPFVLWTLRGSLYSRAVGTYNSIFGQADYYSLDSGAAGFGSILERFVANTGYYYESLCSVVVPFITLREAMPASILFIVFLVALAGFVKELVSGKELKDFYLLFYAGLLTLWPVYGAGDARRYLVPMIPLIYHYLLSGLALIRDLLRPAASILSLEKGRARGLIIAPLIFFVFNSAEIADRVSSQGGWSFDGVKKISEGRLFLDVRDPSTEDIGVERFEETFPCYYTYLHAAFRMKETLSDRDVVMTRKPEEVYLITGRPTIRFPYTSKASLMEGYMRENRVNYILLDSCYEETDRYMRSYVLSKPGSFRVLLTDNRGTALLRVQ
ncbi:MAG: hypothetical protein IT362_01335 [Deltaproteobacteria bacterium]|nr:hypothetical protein [Deltaproteobacteria bacterium]